MSASFHWIAWKLPIGAPNARRSLRVLERLLERRAADPDRLRRDPDAPAVQRLHRHLEALPLAGQQVISRGTRISVKLNCAL